jgi:hypothetical protein
MGLPRAYVRKAVLLTPNPSRALILQPVAFLIIISIGINEVNCMSRLSAFMMTMTLRQKTNNAQLMLIAKLSASLK